MKVDVPLTGQSLICQSNNEAIWWRSKGFMVVMGLDEEQMMIQRDLEAELKLSTSGQHF